MNNRSGRADFAFHIPPERLFTWPGIYTSSVFDRPKYGNLHPAPIQVDSDGGVQAKESKTRFIAPAISVVIASLASYDGRHPDADEPGVYLSGGPLSQAERWAVAWA